MLSAPNPQEASHTEARSVRLWLRRLLILLTILSAIALILVAFWGASHIIASLLIVMVAALIAYAIVPVVDLFHRVMPRPLAILLAYLGVLIILGGVLYFVVTTALLQISIIVHKATFWFQPDSSGKSPLLHFLLNIGVTNDQITAFEQQLVSGLSNLASSLAGSVFPFLL